MSMSALLLLALGMSAPQLSGPPPTEPREIATAATSVQAKPQSAGFDCRFICDINLRECAAACWEDIDVFNPFCELACQQEWYACDDSC